MVQTIFDNSPILLDWEAGLNRQVQFLQFCLELDNRSLLDLLLVQYAADNIDYIANIESHIQDEDPAQSLEKLKGVTVGSLQELKTKFDQKIEELSKVDKNNKEELLKTVNKILQELKVNFRNSISNTSNEGKEIIKTLPELARPFAGRQFSAMLTANVIAFREQTDALKKVIEAISKPEPRKLPEAVELAISNAKLISNTAVDVAQQWIETIAGKIQLPSPTPPPSDSPSEPAPPSFKTISDAELARADRLSFTKTKNGWEIRSI